MRIRQARESLGLTQEELTERMGAHRTYAGTIERGEIGPTLTTIIRLAEALEVDPADLVRGMTSGSSGSRRPNDRRSPH